MLLGPSLLLLAFLDWPQFLGPARNGVYLGADVKWPSQIAWSREVGHGFAGPVIAGNKVILFHRRKLREIVEAFDAKTGQPLWDFQYASTYEDEFGFDDGPRSVPTVKDGVVYTYGAQGMLHALDLETGRKLWHADLQGWYGARKGFFGTGCSPLVANGKVYVIVGGKDFGIGAFDAKTGKLKWGATKHEASYSSPIESPFGLLFLTRRALVVTDPESGKVNFELPFRPRSATSVNAASPVVDGNLVFVSGGYGNGAAVLDFSANPPRRLWGDNDTLSVHYATPVVKDGYLYGLHGLAQTGQELRAVEMKTGKVAWTMKTMGAGTVTLIGNDLLFLRDDGQMFRVRPTPDKLEVLSNAKILDSKVRAHPAVGNGLVCMRDLTTLTCLR